MRLEAALAVGLGDLAAIGVQRALVPLLAGHRAALLAELGGLASSLSKFARPLEGRGRDGVFVDVGTRFSNRLDCILPNFRNESFLGWTVAVALAAA